MKRNWRASALLLLVLPLAARLEGQPFKLPPEKSGAAPASSQPSAPLPHVDLAPLEAKVAAQIRTTQASAETVLARPDATVPERSEALGELAQLYQVYGLAEAATDLYARAAALVPGDFRWPYLPALLAQESGDLASAERGFRRALELRPDWVPAWIHLGEVLIAGNRFDEAESSLRKALDLAPESAAAQADLGQIALSQRRFQDAAKLFEAALRASPEATRLHHPLGLAYRGLGEVEKAKEQLAQAGTVGVVPADPLVAGLESMRTGEGPHLRQGHLLFSNGRMPEAAAEFRQALAANPKSSDALIGLASALSAGQPGEPAQPAQIEEAIAHLREAVQIAPKSAVAHFDLGLLLGQQGKTQEALAAFEQAIQLDPGDAMAHLERGRILERSGSLGGAEGDYLKAAELAPLNEEAQMAAANLLVRRERYARAVALLTEARAMLPRSYRITFALARLLAGAPDLQLRDGAKALPLAEAAYQTQGSVGSAETLAMALAELGRCEEAAARQREAIEIARKAGASAALPGLEKALARYVVGAPCRAGVP